MTTRGARDAKAINLALQGGGAHGAFTWGVLDRLLEEEWLSFDGICGTSAGAMNACVLAAGLVQGGRDGAREKLEDFWRRISRLGPRRLADLVPGTPFRAVQRALAHWWIDGVARTMSPYQFNPLDVNPLRGILAETIDFELVRACTEAKLFVCATNVRSGKVRIFETAEIDVDHVLASACLPNLFRAVEIDGEHYWDGGYRGNPALFPLFHRTRPNDVLLVLLNPIARDRVPRTPVEIADRINEITFNAPLLAELRAIEFVGRLLDRELLVPEAARQYRKILVHAIGADAHLSEFGSASKLAPEWRFLVELRDRGREAASEWLERAAPHLGQRSTVDLKADFLD
jgi:NTE family protein